MCSKQIPTPASRSLSSSQIPPRDTLKGSLETSSPKRRSSLSPITARSEGSNSSQDSLNETESARTSRNLLDASQQLSSVGHGPIRERPMRLQELRRQMSATGSHRQTLPGMPSSSQQESPLISGMDRFSPIIEETTSSLVSPRESLATNSLMSEPQTASTESNQTVKGSAMPFSPGNNRPLTPAYPFPLTTFQSGTPLGTPAVHKPFIGLSPTVQPPDKLPKNHKARDYGNDHLLHSSMRYSIPSSDPKIHAIAEDAGRNMYNIVLRLMSEPGLEAWWTNLAGVIKEKFNAERITLAVPSDTTDIENVPWAQMATYRALEEDPFSGVANEKFSTQSSIVEASSQEGMIGGNKSERQPKNMIASNNGLLASRPKLESRHSFAGFTQKARMGNSETTESLTSTIRRPAAARTGSQSSLRGGRPLGEVEQKNIELNAEALRRHEVSEALKGPPSEDIYASKRPTAARVLHIVQPLESEADALITSAGVIKVLNRNSTAILTREYHDKSQSIEHRLARSTDNGLRNSQWSTVEDQASLDIAQGDKPHPGNSNSTSRTRSQTSGSSKESSASRTVQTDTNISYNITYEDYEQIPASPWSQSPAPSPAVQVDPDVNPFFTSATIDENAFAENPPAHDYSASHPIEAIGVDQASSVIHVPLVHPTLSPLKYPPRLRKTRNKTQSKYFFEPAYPGSNGSSESSKRVPIAILSILSSTVPCPGDLVTFINDLAPFLATSFYNTRQHWNMQKEITGLSRFNQGFGAKFGIKKSEARTREIGTNVLDINESQLSPTAGSDYSNMSMHSPQSSLAGGSINGTPGWTPFDSRLQADDANDIHDGYFSKSHHGTYEEEWDDSTTRKDSTRQKPPNSPALTKNTSSMLKHGPQHLNDTSRKSGMGKMKIDDAGRGKPAVDLISRLHDSPQSRRTVSDFSFLEASDKSIKQSLNFGTPNLGSQSDELLLSPRRHAMFQATHQIGHHHTIRKHRHLHSDGVDFSATNPSLPHATAIVAGPPQTSAEVSTAQETKYMFKDPTPSMLRIMIDTGATQEFIAECVKGTIVWANSKFQSYRSQSAEEIHEDPWNNIHYKDRKSFRKLWKSALETGEQLSHQVRLRRFDGQYRWFQMRILPLKDKHDVIRHWHGQAMDIHDRHEAEVEAAREKEKAASESKYRSLANSNPHIIFAASVPTGMTFANTQWLSYSGQTLEETLGFGFLEHVHPEDISRCRFPDLGSLANIQSLREVLSPKMPYLRQPSPAATDVSTNTATTDATVKPNVSGIEAPNDLLRSLVKAGIIKCSKDGQGNLSITTEMRLRSKDNEYRWHLVQGSLIDSVNFGQGESQWFIACADITDQKRNEEQLKQICDALNKEMRRKMEYLSSMSHEIRTPLNGILGNLQFLMNSGLDEHQSNYTFGASQAAEGMHKLINDILDVSKAEAKMLKLFYDWFSVQSVIEEAVETLNAKASQKGLELCYEVTSSVPPSIKGDKSRIKQVLLNLVGNAIKFTQRGEIWMKCDTMQDPAEASRRTNLESNETYLRFTVKDTGNGFSPEEKKLLFKPYSQIDNSNTRGNGGTGLGLILCKNMVELHGGRIDATSVPGQGSIFTFYARFGIRDTTHDPDESYSSVVSEILSPRAQLVQGQILQGHMTESPGPSAQPSASAVVSPAAQSSGSSSISTRSLSLQPSVRSSASTVDNEAHVASMKLHLPALLHSGSSSDLESNETIDVANKQASEPIISRLIPAVEPESFRPPLLSILIVCPQENTRRTTQDHIQRILPKSIPARVTAHGNVDASQMMIMGDDPSTFTHVVLQLSSPKEVLGFMDSILNSISHPHTCIVVVTDQTQKSAITEGAPDFDYAQLAIDDRLRFIMKPARPHKFAKIFDPDQENAQSNDDKTGEEAREKQRLQKEAFKLFKEVLGNKGIRVLAVEDNNLNMEVCYALRVR